jgi:hypothetical protein
MTQQTGVFGHAKEPEEKCHEPDETDRQFDRSTGRADDGVS